MYASEFSKERKEPIEGWNITPRRLRYFQEKLQSAGMHAYIYLSGVPAWDIKNQPEEEQPNYTLLATRKPLAIPLDTMGIVF